MSIELSSLSLEELVSLIDEAKALIVEKQELEIQKGYLQVVQIANELGLSVEELMARGRGVIPKAKVKKPVEPRYRNPLNAAETWTGRGKQPRWVQEKISRGITLEDMLIK